jgi:hypothetical protein
MNSFERTCDAMGRATDALPPSNAVCVLFLAAGVGKQVAVPGGARIVLASATGDVWMRVGGPAALPTADILDGSAPELNPAARTLGHAATIGVVAPKDCVLSLAFYR